MASPSASQRGAPSPQPPSTADHLVDLTQIFKIDVTPLGGLPADARGEASYLARRILDKKTRIERDPNLTYRGVGKTPLVPAPAYVVPNRVHLASANRYNQALAATESLSSVLDDLAAPEPIAATSAAPQADEEAAAEGEADAAPASPGGESASTPADALDALSPLTQTRASTNWLSDDAERPAGLNLEEKSLPDGWTPLFHAVRSGRLSDVQTLLHLGANPNARDRHANVPLHKAAIAGATEKIRVLIENGADMEASNRYGQTALHAAADVGWRETCALLVRLGARHDAKDGPLRDGQTPYQVASNAGWTDVCIALKANERRRVKLAAGDTALYSATFPSVSPTPFSPKRMNVYGEWGRDSKHGTWGACPDPSLSPPNFKKRETKYF